MVVSELLLLEAVVTTGVVGGVLVVGDGRTVVVVVVITGQEANTRTGCYRETTKHHPQSKDTHRNTGRCQHYYRCLGQIERQRGDRP